MGRRVFVHCPNHDGARVMLTDDAGVAAKQSLGDGAEVEILAWKPRAAGGPRYRVHCLKTGLEGWVAAAQLRPGTR